MAFNLSSHKEDATTFTTLTNSLKNRSNMVRENDPIKNSLISNNQHSKNNALSLNNHNTFEAIPQFPSFRKETLALPDESSFNSMMSFIKDLKMSISTTKGRIKNSFHIGSQTSRQETKTEDEKIIPIIRNKHKKREEQPIMHRIAPILSNGKKEELISIELKPLSGKMVAVKKRIQPEIQIDTSKPISQSKKSPISNAESLTRSPSEPSISKSKYQSHNKCHIMKNTWFTKNDTNDLHGIKYKANADLEEIEEQLSGSQFEESLLSNETDFDKAKNILQVSEEEMICLFPLISDGGVFTSSKPIVPEVLYIDLDI